MIWGRADLTMILELPSQTLGKPHRQHYQFSTTNYFREEQSCLWFMDPTFKVIRIILPVVFYPQNRKKKWRNDKGPHDV